VLNTTKNFVHLSWPAVNGSTRFKYSYGAFTVDVGGTSWSAHIRGLTPATNYVFSVTVYGDSGTGNTIECHGTTGELIIILNFI